MIPEVVFFLTKSRESLAAMDKMLEVGLYEDAGRRAYISGFQAAQAYLLQRLGRSLKTHNGVQTEFLRLARMDDGIDPELRTFLSKTYHLKSVADYAIGPNAYTSADEAHDAASRARRFVACVTDAVASFPD